MEKKNGFTMIEVFLASSIFFSTVLIFIPIINQIETEKIVLKERREITITLHEKFQYYIWETDAHLPQVTTEIIDERNVQFSFNQAGDYIKGCVYWENGKQRPESFCLYGLSIH